MNKAKPISTHWQECRLSVIGRIQQDVLVILPWEIRGLCWVIRYAENNVCLLNKGRQQSPFSKPLCFLSWCFPSANHFPAMPKHPELTHKFVLTFYMLMQWTGTLFPWGESGTHLMPPGDSSVGVGQQLLLPLSSSRCGVVSWKVTAAADVVAAGDAGEQEAERIRLASAACLLLLMPGLALVWFVLIWNTWSDVGCRCLFCCPGTTTSFPFYNVPFDLGEFLKPLFNRVLIFLSWFLSSRSDRFSGRGKQKWKILIFRLPLSQSNWQGKDWGGGFAVCCISVSVFCGEFLHVDFFFKNVSSHFTFPGLH